ncbi:ABC transporter permease subunit [Paenibacillaceae bacterium WGS1546]|uniref:ABC transporter permease subunit n=1 Tax=Cohnella sp. WGS1546 TaxID=3366810 RepID=UPI00372D0AA9
MIRLELYKIYMQKVIYIAFAVFAALYISQFYNELQPAHEIEGVRAAYKEYGGALTEEKLAWAEETEAAFQKQYQDSVESGVALDPILRYQSQVANDILSASSYRAMLAKQRQEREAWLSLPKAQGGPTEAQRREAIAVLKVAEAIGAPDYVMDQHAWLRTLQFMNEIGYFFVVALAIIGLAGSFSREYANGMDQLLLSSRHGRSKAVVAKLAAAAIYCASLVALFSAIVFLLHGYYYSFAGWDRPLVNLFRLYSSTGFGGQIWQFYLLQQICAIGGCVALGWLTVLFSSWTRNMVLPAMLGGLAFILPVIIIFMNLPTEGVFRTVLHVLRYMEYIQAEYIDSVSYYPIFGQLLLYRNGVWINLFVSLAVTVGLLYATIRRRQVK